MKLDLKLLYRIALWTSILGIIGFISDFGFSQSDFSQKLLDWFYFIVLGVGIISTFARYIENSRLSKRKVLVFDFLSICFTMDILHVSVCGCAFRDGPAS